MIFRKIAAVLSVAFLAAPHSQATQSEPVEGAPIFFARDLLSGIQLRTDTYRVSPLVEVKDFEYEFSISSKYGNFKPRGVEELKGRLREIEAIGRLSEVSQSEAFTKTLSNSFTEPVSTTLGVARRPISSVTGLPGGIVRYFGGKLYQVQRGGGKAMEKVRDFRSKEEEPDESELDEPEEKKKREIGKSAGKLSRKHLGHDSSKRKWARELGVDPYSDNQALQDALGRIAWASSLGGFAGDFVVPSSEVFSYAGKARQLVWDRPAYQIEREIMDLLKKYGVEKNLIVAFRDCPTFSLTEKLQLTLAFQNFNTPSSIRFLVEYALLAESEEDAALFLSTVDLLVVYIRDAGEIISIGEKRGMIRARSREGYEIYPLAVDYLHWTPLVYDALLSPELESEKREIWVSGIVSPVAKSRLRLNGWEVFDQIEPVGSGQSEQSASR
ncbi:hypothetical protein [Pelagicoccus albus]|uniref:Uncharacterized protein n=1 Tax=Pelagicoccus albus TaxID=415222 RepID=A0A7X1B326_9BACT|nr:hypothetical protein [Pelagicoccus albus]MBC2604741.1 hypothetical protein [Pelagicoccus albus]